MDRFGRSSTPKGPIKLWLVFLIIGGCSLTETVRSIAQDSTTHTLQNFVMDDETARRAIQLLQNKCVSCHGAEKVEGGFRLDSLELLQKGGERGSPLRDLGGHGSLLIRSISGELPDLEMPPKQPLEKDEQELLAKWVQAGTPWPSSTDPQPLEKIGNAWTDPENPVVKIFGGKRLDLWSFQPLGPSPRKATVQPASSGQGVDDSNVAQLDQIVGKKFASQNGQLSLPADSSTLIRRLHFDLTGLPPDWETIANHPKSLTEDAWSEHVDQLLNSREFGEHWARMWLDMVRYSDSNGYDWDEFRPQAWRFRDYVIRSLNADKPIDTFIREQLAGDELFDGPPLEPKHQDQLIATGFLRLGPHDNAAGLFNEQDRSRHELLTDLVETTGSAFLGMTLSCCRCHDHKYDPLTQADHFRMRAFFASVKFSDDLPLDLKQEQETISEHNKKLDDEINEWEAKREELFEKLRQRLGKPKANENELSKHANEAEKTALSEIRGSLTQWKKDRRTWTTGLVMLDALGEPPETRILYGGDHKTPRDIVQPGIFSVWNPNPMSAAESVRTHSSGRRLALANWIVSKENPLTARVLVNRVWQSLFGDPIVATPGDFGLAGELPENQELLDYLAAEFFEQGWSLKKLIRTIVMSKTYRQRSRYEVAPSDLNHAWRKPRRLTGEQVRDSLLRVSGLLTDKSNGPPIWPELPKEVLEANPAFLDDNETKTKGWYVSEKETQFCRSIFLVQKRNTRIPFLEIFDQPENSTPCVRRLKSIVAPQAMSLLNGSLALDATKNFASLLKELGIDEPDQIRRGFEMALQRHPTTREREACRDLVAKGGIEEFCRALFNTNEFVYIE